MKRHLSARWLLVGAEVRENWQLAFDDETGRILELGPSDDDSGEGVAIVPGLVNAHSHAFQIAIRGRAEHFVRTHENDDFWTWREQMYGAALTLDADEIEALSRRAFREMLLAGITSVGEFHYLHHRPDGAPYEDPNELAKRVIRAARDVGIRIALLRVAYERSGFEQSASDRQRRFIEPDVETYLSRTRELAAAFADHPHVNVGMAPHSIRAVSRRWLEAIAGARTELGCPLHIHTNEQRRELDESNAEHGLPPLLALDEMGVLGEDTTVVHATHVTDEELDVLQARAVSVCACPTTERNLGDGFLPATGLVERGVPICLGSDSQANIDLWEEMRLVEYHERLRNERRNVLAAAAAGDAERVETADVLWPMGTLNGAHALGFDAGVLAPGKLADFVVIDLDHITLAGVDTDSMLTTLCLSSTPGIVKEVYVGGRRVGT